MMQSFRQPRLEDFLYFFFFYCCTQLFTRKTVTEIAVLRMKTVEILAPRQSGSWGEVGVNIEPLAGRKVPKTPLFLDVGKLWTEEVCKVVWPECTVTVCVAVTRLLSRGQRLKTQRVNKLYDEHKLRLSDPTSPLLTLNSSYTVSYQHNDPTPERVSPILPHLSSFIRPLCIQPRVSRDSAAMNSARGMQTNH